MTTLSQLPQVTTMASGDTFVINDGTKQRVISKSDLEAVFTGLGGYSIEQVTPTADYTLATTSANEVWVYLDGDSYGLTIPDDSTIAIGTKYIVFNTHLTTYGTLTVASGATLSNITSGQNVLKPSTTNEAYSAAIFYKTGASTWVASGDIAGAPQELACNSL